MAVLWRHLPFILSRLIPLDKKNVLETEMPLQNSVPHISKVSYGTDPKYVVSVCLLRVQWIKRKLQEKKKKIPGSGNEWK